LDRERLQALFERSTTPMVLVDDERRYRDCNPAACDVLATSRETLLTMRLDERVPAETLPGLDERWQRFLKLDAYSGASSLVTADGAVVIGMVYGPYAWFDGEEPYRILNSMVAIQ